MDVTVQVLALVPAEAACLPDTVESFRDLGPVTVYDTTGDRGIAEAARAAGVALEPVQWRDSYADCFNTVLAARPDAARLLVHADEVVEQVVEQGRERWPEAVEQGRPGTILIRHRTAPDAFFNEEREARFAPPGHVLTYRGRFPPASYEQGRPATPADLPALPLVLAHYPDRWLGLARQRIGRTITAVEAALAEEPDDAGHHYALLHCHVSLRDWPRVVECAGRWRAVAAADDPRASLVDYHEASSRLRAGDARSAQRLLRTATERSPRFADAWFLLGELRRLAGDTRTAAAAFRRAHEAGLEADPVAVEDYSLSTWRPLEELARLADDGGDHAQAGELRAQAAQVRAGAGSGDDGA